MPSIKEITSIETFQVRHPVLRAGKSVESCQFEGDDFETTIHFGFFDNDKIVGVTSIFKNNNSLFANPTTFQIRGMAVLEGFQKSGIGKKLLIHSEHHLISKKSDLIWFNARENAVGFYKKLGYSIIGKRFEIKDVGNHFVMYKKLHY